MQYYFILYVVKIILCATVESCSQRIIVSFIACMKHIKEWPSHSSNKENLAQFKIGLNCTFDWAGFAPKTYAVGTLLNNLNKCINECIPDMILMQKIAKLFKCRMHVFMPK